MGQKTSAAGLRALQSAIQGAGDEQVVRIVDLVDTLDRQDAETILAPIRPRLRILRLERSLQLSRLLGMPLEPALIDSSRWRPAACGLPRSALEPLCDAILVRSPALVKQVGDMIAGGNTGDTTLVRAAGEVFWPGAAAALAGATDVPETWAKAGLPAASFPYMAGATAACLETALQLDAMADPTMNRPDLEISLSAMLRRAQAAGPLAWSILLVVLFCALPDAQAPQTALFSQGVSELRLPAEAALQQIWTWIEAAGISTPRNFNDAATSLRQRVAILKGLATSRGQRARAAAQQAHLREAYTQHVAEAAQERLIAPLDSLATSPTDMKMAVMEDHARGLRRLLIEIRNLGGPPEEASVLQDAVRAACACEALRPMDRARLVECLGYPKIAAKLLKH